MRPLAVAALLVALSLATLRYALHLHDASLASLHARSPPGQPQTDTDTDTDAIILAEPPARNQQHHQPAALGNSPDGLFHFIQISDLHVSKYRTRGGLAHLDQFLSHELNLVAPDLVLATGDLTDAKTRNSLNSVQYREEWVSYHTALTRHGVIGRQGGRFWWDQRGNHDCFNVPSFASSQNLFRELSAVQSEGYAFRVIKPFGVYRFVAVDACPVVGVSRPINFFGYLDTNDMDFLASQVVDALRRGDNHTFVMSHYPTATMLFGRTSAGTAFWTISQHISLWLCGHLHKLVGGLGETMYAYQDTFLELELGDLKTHGLFRVVVVDHDIVSFVDTPIHADVLPIPHNQVQPHGEHGGNQTSTRSSAPPIVVVTNPKDARFAIPGREPMDLIRTSTHIRILAWSEQPIERIVAFIDGKKLAANATYRGVGKRWRSLADKDPHLPLWVIPWQPSAYDDSASHSLVISVRDTLGTTTNRTIVFNIDGTRITNMDTGPGGFIISIPFGILFKDLFIISYIIVCIIFLLIPKLFVCITTELGTFASWRRETSRKLIALDITSQAYRTRVRTVRPTLMQRFAHKTIDLDFTLRATFFRFCELTRVPSLFYPLFLLNLYLLVGPWFIGEFVSSANSGTDHQPHHNSSVSMSSESGRRYGWMMVYGVWFTDGTWTPLLDTWLYAFHGIVYKVLPLEFYLSFCCTSPVLLYMPENPRHVRPIHSRWYVHVIVLVSILYHLVDSVSMALFYGVVSAVVAPAKTWLCLWAAVVLWVWRNGPRGAAAHAYSPVRIDDIDMPSELLPTLVLSPENDTDSTQTAPATVEIDTTDTTSIRRADIQHLFTTRSSQNIDTNNTTSSTQPNAVSTTSGSRSLRPRKPKS